nr:Chain B, Protein Wnt-7a [Homo sapiens]
CHGVSGSC